MNNTPWLETLANLEQEWVACLPPIAKLDFANEMRFFNLILIEDPKLQTYASDPLVVKSVMLHQARTGLTLDPDINHAYVGERDGKMIFMPGYKGLTEIGIQEKLILSCSAELVFKTDDYKWIDSTTKPHHEKLHPFGTAAECGDLAGGFCVTKRCDGELIVSSMSIEQLLDIREYALSVNSTPETSAWYDTSSVRIWSMYKKTLQRKNTENWSFGNNPRMVAALSYAMPDQLDNQIERAFKGVTNQSSGPETDTVTIEPSSSLPDSLDEYKERIDNLATNARKFNVWKNFEAQVRESYGKNRAVLEYALGLIPENIPETPGATTSGDAT